MRVALQKMQGVESVDVSLNEGKAVIRLQPGNSVSLGQIRKAVTEKGFTPKEARIEAAGDLSAVKDGLRFEVTGAGEGFAAEPSAHKEWREKAGRNLRVTGIIAAPSGEEAAGRIQLLTVSRQSQEEPPKRNAP